MDQDGRFAPYRPLEFDVRGPFCEGEECAVSPELAVLQFEITEVFGTSPGVAVGERYVVNGRYRLPGDDPYTISIAVFRTAFGASAHVRPGEGLFSTSAEIIELSEGAPNGLGVVVGHDATGKCEIVRWVMLRQE